MSQTPTGRRLTIPLLDKDFQRLLMAAVDAATAHGWALCERDSHIQGEHLILLFTKGD